MWIGVRNWSQSRESKRVEKIENNQVGVGRGSQKNSESWVGDGTRSLKKCYSKAKVGSRGRNKKQKFRSPNRDSKLQEEVIAYCFLLLGQDCSPCCALNKYFSIPHIFLVLFFFRECEWGCGTGVGVGSRIESKKMKKIKRESVVGAEN